MSKKSRGSGTGKFILGTFMGFLICLLLIAGIGLFVYYNVSVNWINSTFKTNIDAGEDFNSKTPNELISALITFTGNIDNYTVNDLKEDFGINLGDKIMGIDITDLKDVKFQELGSAIEDKFANISAEELKDIFDFTDMNKIINKTNTYYVFDGKLYEDAEYNNEVGFDYSINSNKVKIKSYEFNIVENKVDVELRYLPLTKAISSFTSNMGDKITVGELEEDYGVKLPTYLTNTDAKKAKTINELQTIINDVTVAEILGYTNVGGTYYDGTTPLTGIMKAIAGKQVDELAGTIDELKLSDVFENDEFNSGALSILKGNEDSLVKDFSTTMGSVLTNLTINDLYNAGIITLTQSQVEKLDDVVSGKTVGEMLITDIVIEFIDDIA